MKTTLLLCAVLALPVVARAQGIDPPFRSTEWLNPNIITDADPSSLRGIAYAGEGERHFLETREGEPWRIVLITVHVFDVTFNGKRMEFQVHPEIGARTEARAQVDTYAPIFGRLPWELRARVTEVEIQLQGNKPSHGHGYDWTDPRAASHEAEGRGRARGGGADRVGPPPCWRHLRLLCQIGDELVPGVEQFLLVDDVSPILYL